MVFFLTILLRLSLIELLQENLLETGAFQILTEKGHHRGALSELIFVTNVTNYIRGEKIVMWRNSGKFWEVLPQFARFHVEKN